ncbi:MAG: TlpA family protein disulfide reductase [Sphingobacteriales bacterium]
MNTLFIKRCSLILILLYSTIFSAAQSSNLFIKGKILNSDNALVFEDISAIGELSVVHASAVIAPESNGDFKFQHYITRAGYFRIGRNILYLQPKDTLEVVIDKFSREKSTFVGKNAFIQDYLKWTPYPKAGSYLNGGDNVKKTLQATLDTLEAIKQNRKLRLDNTKGLPPDFRHLEDVRIEVDLLNSVYSLHIYFARHNRLTGDSLNRFMDQYRQTIKAYSLKMPYTKLRKDYLSIQVYRDVLPQLIRQIPIDAERNAYWEDWLNAKILRLEMEGATSRDSLQVIASKLPKIKNSKFRKALETSVQSFMLVSTGDNVIPFVYKNTDDAEVNLERYKGKVIYVDFWATWCGPCIKEFKYLDELKAKFTDSNIVFLSISVDENKDRWKEFMQKVSDAKHHGIVSWDQIRDYNLAAIPRVIIIDKDFKLAAIHGPLPSSKETSALLEKLTKK